LSFLSISVSFWASLNFLVPSNFSFSLFFFLIIAYSNKGSSSLLSKFDKEPALSSKSPRIRGLKFGINIDSYV